MGSKPNENPTGTFAPYGGPDGITVRDCSFTLPATDNLFGRGALWILGQTWGGTKYGQFKNVAFYDCTLTSDNSSWEVVKCGTIDPSTNDPVWFIAGTSSIYFESCTFQASIAQNGMMWKVEAPFTGQKVTVNLVECTFKVKATATAALVGTGDAPSASMIEVVVEGDPVNSVRQPSPATPSNPASTRPLQSGDFSGLTFTEA